MIGVVRAGMVVPVSDREGTTFCHGMEGCSKLERELECTRMKDARQWLQEEDYSLLRGV